MIRNAEWGDFINVLPIKKGDYFNITPGTVHAIKGGTMILEIQQNSDLTYRIYDYDRVANGEKRQLHIDKSLDVINAPFNMGECKVGRVADSSGAEHFSCKYYDIWMVPIEGNYTVANSASMLDVVVLGGEGEVNGIKIKKGDAFLIPANFGETKFMGGLEIMLAKAN
jgi:mannose-6-phosphate isomerase class I